MLFRSKVDLRYLAIAYDGSDLTWPGQFIQHLQVTCYLNVASTGKNARGVRKAQIDSWLAELQPGIVWSSINGGLYGSEPFEEDRQSNGQRKLHPLLGEVPCSNKKRQQVMCFLRDIFISF